MKESTSIAQQSMGISGVQQSVSFSGVVLTTGKSDSGLGPSWPGRISGKSALLLDATEVLPREWRLIHPVTKLSQKTGKLFPIRPRIGQHLCDVTHDKDALYLHHWSTADWKHVYTLRENLFKCE